MKKLLLFFLLLGTTTNVSALANKKTEEQPISFGEVSEYIDLVHDYFYDSYYCDRWNWPESTYHLGVLEAYKATGHMNFYNESYNFAEGYSWRVNEGVLDTYLDQVTSSMVYCVLHDLAPADYKLEHSIEEAEYISAQGMFDSSWIDELYMVGLTMSYLSKVTHNPWYSEVDFATYKYYRDMFFDAEDGLWYRDAKYISGSGHPASVSPNGKKVYWGRGNTWVYVSLAQRMEYMDHDDPAYETYLNDYLAMSNGLRKAVRPDGVWGANLGDIKHSEGKEMTGTGGFLYGLCLGLEYGLLDWDVYYPVVEKAYKTITSECIYSNGLLGYCQPVGEGPDGYSGGEEAYKTNTNSFGVGLVLMGLSRFMRLTQDYRKPTYAHTVEPFNPNNARYTVDTSYYKGLMVATTSANCEANNGPENLVNGVYSRINEYGRFSASGLRNQNIVVDIQINENIHIDKFAIMPYQFRAYKVTIEALVDGQYVTVVDTRNTPTRDSYLFTYPLTSSVYTNKLRFTGYGYHNGTTDMFSIKELFIYEEK